MTIKRYTIVELQQMRESEDHVEFNVSTVNLNQYRQMIEQRLKDIIQEQK